MRVQTIAHFPFLSNPAIPIWQVVKQEILHVRGLKAASTISTYLGSLDCPNSIFHADSHHPSEAPIYPLAP